MKVDLKKVPKENKEFSVEYRDGEDFAHFCGYFFGKPPFLVVEGKIDGKIEVNCDISGEKFFDQFKEEVKIKVVEGSYKGFDEVYDIIESDGSVFDFEAFLKDEVEIFKNDYHKKEELEDKEFILENL
jgi:hypothetical protein